MGIRDHETLTLIGRWLLNRGDRYHRSSKSDPYSGFNKDLTVTFIPPRVWQGDAPLVLLHVMACLLLNQYLYLNTYIPNTVKHFNLRNTIFA